MASGGRILCMSSIAGIKGLPEFGAYGASKFAVFGLCEALRGDFERRGIALSVICPPAVDTPMVKNLGDKRPALYDIFPFAKKEEVVDAIMRAIGTRDQFLILGDAQSKLFYRANGLMPRITSRVMEGLTQRKRRKATA
jgi:short-subunit dehydrogenase